MNPRTLSVAEGVIVLCVGPFVAASCLAWWLIGAQDEPTGEDQWFSIAIAEEHSWLIGAIGVLVALAVALALRGWPQPWRAPVSVPLGLSCAAGAYLGLFLRAATAEVTGANIGAGILAMAAPVVLVAVALAVTRVVRLVRGFQSVRR